MTTIVLRTVILYSLLVAAMRLTGKRQIGELQLSELVTTLLVSEIAATPIVSPQSSLWNAVVPILLVVFLELVISFLVTKSATIKAIFDGKPSFLINRGAIDQKEMLRQRVSVDELLSALRQKGFSDLSDVSYAIMEQNGQVSVFSMKECTEFSHPIVIDGKINPAALKATGKDQKWLENKLLRKSCPLKDVFLYTLTDSGKEFLARKSKK
jgi:uncharacterized membrane protein YcaP (DUF421 family)